MAEIQDSQSTERPVTLDVPAVPNTEEVTLTPEEAEMWLTKKGSIPKAIRKQVAVLRRKKRMADRHVEVTPKGIVQRPRMELFLSEFINNGGNATQAALSVFNCSTIESAAVMGHKYLKQARGLSRVYLEKKGYTYGKMLDIATQKLEASKTPEWWDRLMKMADYADFMTKKDSRPSVVNIVAAQRNLQKEFGFMDGEIVEDDQDGTEEL
jgi:hypothetical protein